MSGRLIPTTCDRRGMNFLSVAPLSIWSFDAQSMPAHEMMLSRSPYRSRWASLGLTPGVICDSVGESSRSGFKAVKNFWPEVVSELEARQGSSAEEGAPPWLER